jgi:predicted transcriptional regulator
MRYAPDMPKATKVLVTMPNDLLERIDREAKSSSSTRSDFLQEAARRQLGWPDPIAIDAALERGRAALADAGSFESAELIRSEREGRDARDRRR